MKNIVFLSISLILLASASTTSNAEDHQKTAETSIAVIGLKGGFDSNPSGVAGEKGSPVGTVYATWNYLRGTIQDGYGLNLTLVETQYDPRNLAAARGHSLTLKHGITLGEATVIQSSLSAADEQTWSRRKSSLAWRERIDHALGPFRLFASGEARITALNERNVFNLGDFLPWNENFATLSGATGVAWKSGQTEIGVSFSVAQVRFVDGVDYIGFRRDHYRLQPNLFFSTMLGDATLEGSLSPFRAAFPDKEFETVDSLLYTAKLKLPWRSFALELGSNRSVEDTTLPFTVIDLVTSHEAKVTAKIDERNAVSLIARRKTDDYVGLDARSDQKSIGLEYQRALGDGLLATASGSWRRTKETGLAPVDSFNLLLGFQKQIDLSRGLPAGSNGQPTKKDG